MNASTTRTMLTHNKIQLALHTLASGDSSHRPLLLLHGLGEDSSVHAKTALPAWKGPIYGLDFTGHGMSTVPKSGGYTAEILVADTDIALAHLGECTILGRGLGAYVGLIVAGARPELVHGVVLCDGPGFSGGSSHVHSQTDIQTFHPRAGTAPDPWAMLELSRDNRPPAYVSMFLRMAIAKSTLQEPVALVAHVRPPWAEAVAESQGVMTNITVAEALAIFASE